MALDHSMAPIEPASAAMDQTMRVDLRMIGEYKLLRYESI